MRSLGARLTVLTLLFAAAIAASAQGRGPATPPAGPSIHLDPDTVRRQMIHVREELVDVNNQSTLEKYLRAVAGAASAEEQDQLVSEMGDYCVERGLKPAPDVADALLSLGIEARGAGDWEKFRRLARFAATFAPDYPPVHLALAEAARHQEGFLSSEALFETMATAFTLLKNVETRWLALANLATWLRLAAGLLLMILALLLLIQYQALLRHDVREWLGGSEARWVGIAGWVVIFLPSLLFLAGYWWIVYWAGLFLLYARWSERIAVLLAVALFVASGTLQITAYQKLYLAQSAPNVSNIRCYANRIDVSRDGYLASHLTASDPLRETYAFLLANRYLLHGSYLKAEGLFQDVIKANPMDANAGNNLGCLYFYENRYQEAIQQFSRAIQNRPDMALAYLNRAMAKTKVFDFSGSREDQDQARRLDASLFRRYNLTQTEEWSPIPAWMPIGASSRISETLDAHRTTLIRGAAKPGASWLSRTLAPAFSLWAILFVLAFLTVAIVKKAGFFAHACFKCGQPFCARCKTSLEFESFCSQCVHLYIKQDGVSPEARLRKNYEVDQHLKAQKVQRAVFSLLAPGTTHFFDGRPFSSTFLLFLWCGLLAGFFSKQFLFPLSFAVPLGTAPLTVFYTQAAAVLLALLWGLFGLPAALRPAPHPTVREWRK